MTINELNTVKRLTRWEQTPSALGFADDAALISVAEGRSLVLSQDALVENIDFTRATFSAADVAHKALAENLSDLAAMGATPRWFLQTLCLPDWVSETWIDDYSVGSRELAKRFGVSLLGGDLSRIVGPLVISMAVIGEVSKEKILRRKVGQIGDVLCVGGYLGRAGAGLLALQKGFENDYPSLVKAQRRPEPQIELGLFLNNEIGCHGAMDLSDGLAQDLKRFLPDQLGATIFADAIPINHETQKFARQTGCDVITLALSGGEDFVLLFAVAKECKPDLFHRAQKAGFSVYEIGQIEEVPGLHCILSSGNEMPWPQGFDHFSEIRCM